MKNKLSFIILSFITYFTFTAQPAKSFVSAGDIAPNFALVSVNGDTFKLANYSGKPVLLNFFHYNWTFCIAEAPQIEQTWKKYQSRGVQILGINTLSSGESAQIVNQTYIIPTGTTYPVLIKGSSVGAVYGATKEFYFVIDGTGVCTYRGNGYNKTEVENALEAALAATNVAENPIIGPENFKLDQNYPNPFNSQTVINFQISKPGSQVVSLKIYNLLGKEVKTLIDQNLWSGAYSYTWDGLGNDGRPVTSGIYYYILQTGNIQKMKKMTLMQ